MIVQSMPRMAGKVQDRFGIQLTVTIGFFYIKQMTLLSLQQLRFVEHSSLEWHSSLPLSLFECHKLGPGFRDS